ncbi:FAD-dependent oxidoreductase [Alkalicaulis satelles]|uniref:FAD-dependent oxidoreductase n=1 Tax=Alkalicaulis satelles TaxID=2609175 RepID=A0A5M6ZS64_9PROT|nr:FAD-dependent oxidoreductase [Alkalicaulis satelles]KAA5805141.1 FAD-dependent oxidoreductase [Alkalicaulis satelles]
MTAIEPVLTRRSQIAVIGAGVSGLGAAWALRGSHDVTLYEKDARLGGHANTVTIDYDGASIDVDTGFIVYNELNYPNMTALFAELGVETFRTDMSFGFSLDRTLEWSSNGLKGLFADPANLARPGFLGMLRDIVHFNASARRDLVSGSLHGLTLGQYLDRIGVGERFRACYLLPMGAAIWSSSEAAMADYPAEAFVKFFNNHRLMHASRPQWQTVKGGSRTYVRRIAADLEAAGVALADGARSVRRDGGSVWVTGADGAEQRFDEVILACHADQALRLLSDADADERELLGAIPYAPNMAVLHRDTSFLPARKGARAAWCYMREAGEAGACVTYDMNRLQGIDPSRPLMVTLNPGRQPDPALTFGRFEYDHPQFTAPGLAAQRIFNRIQGVKHTWFAGAWLGYGFHEDGLRAGLRAALRLGGSIPWVFADGDVSGGAWGPRPQVSSPARRAGALPAAE